LPRGAFVKEIERSLLAGDIDVAVHSAKDLPTDETPGTGIVAYLPREDPRDAIVSRGSGGVDGLDPGARVGTESVRRRAFLLRVRPDVEAVPIRGNVDTRLRKMDAGEYDALVVAVAGLARLGLSERIAERVSIDQMLPAVGQGAIAVETRSDDPVVERVGVLDDLECRVAVLAERSFLKSMGGGCRAPFAAHARTVGDRLVMDGAAIHPEGRDLLGDRIEGAMTESISLGEKLAESLLARGADELASGNPVVGRE
jgi:hydroxymethylbilane synthase